MQRKAECKYEIVEDTFEYPDKYEPTMHLRWRWGVLEQMCWHGSRSFWKPIEVDVIER